MSQRSLARFVEHLVHRHHGDTHAALVEAKALTLMSQFGRPWWRTVTAQLAYRDACERLTPWRGHV